MMVTVAKQAAPSREMYNGVPNADAETATLAEKRIAMKKMMAVVAEPITITVMVNPPWQARYAILKLIHLMVMLFVGCPSQREHTELLI
jgi:hypothetical protein